MSGWLGAFPLAEVLTEADRAILEQISVVSSFSAGHVFVREGDRADAVTAAMFFLIEGQVGVASRAPEGGFGVQRTLGPGHAFGTIALVADVPRVSTCTALTPVKAARLDRRSFDELFRRDAGVHARFQLGIARSLAADLRALQEQLATLHP